MTDDDRKLLTEFLGECWHLELMYSPKNLGYICQKCGCFVCNSGDYFDDREEILEESHRAFTSPDDMMALKNRIKELELDVFFDAFITREWRIWFEGDDGQFIYFWDWLMNPERFCQLVADYHRGN
ncbi:MAG: hypothetical protein A4E69_00276 [Syntrophus sp. PtaB.Bin138]|nr:MAG: hypothetical protein A4E69_00276 [Syntrophus sp. PtaB.Bin138]